MSQRARRTASALLAGVVLSLALTACSGGDDTEQSLVGLPESTPTAPAEVATDIAVGAVEGRLSFAGQQQVVALVQPVVDAWIDGAYLGGDYPRTDFSSAWSGFTPGARARAERDADLTTNRAVGADIDGVETLARRVRLDVLAVRQRPAAVTARVALRFATTGAVEQRVRVRGRLYLTPDEQGWRVFGFDVAKAAR